MKKFLLGLGLGALATGVATVILSQKECDCCDCDDCNCKLKQDIALGGACCDGYCSLDKEFEERKEGKGYKASDLTDKEFYKSLDETEPQEEIIIYLHEI